VVVVTTVLVAVWPGAPRSGHSSNP